MPTLALRLSSYLVTRIATSGTVLHREPEGKHEVEYAEGAQADCCNYGIPVGAEELTDHVVSVS